MAKKYEVYKCEDCACIVMLMDAGSEDLLCCGKNMIHMPEQTADSSKEKHVPIIKKIDGGFEVKVGSIPHPMLENHWIQWIELVVDGQRMLRELGSSDEPKAYFSCSIENPKKVAAREYCNIHGLWRGE
ncbi:Superoxide reductase [Olavius algarvensis spirochete endosymbiont]|uniref:desulfoferrodoxin n=1 Tax=Olavius algarvensis spirochete endosymbiont TaxID=260710 RepID=UPI00052BE99C|nr:desulfoferrodoxin [Olavius algarvensis spirochete endosymbiont]KGM38390.1 desulfoferrodoxin [Alkalispirochaeta odontotermitis]VDB00156.1 Superoxide reductase [Olavius algarvensis spirochete endosymbiont]